MSLNVFIFKQGADMKRYPYNLRCKKKCITGHNMTCLYFDYCPRGSEKGKEWWNKNHSRFRFPLLFRLYLWWHWIIGKKGE